MHTVTGCRAGLLLSHSLGLVLADENVAAVFEGEFLPARIRRQWHVNGLALVVFPGIRSGDLPRRALVGLLGLLGDQAADARAFTRSGPKLALRPVGYPGVKGRNVNRSALQVVDRKSTRLNSSHLG